MSDEAVHLQADVRAGDADRDATLRLLRQHYEAGRLDEHEFEARMQGALTATTIPDLTYLLEDLPPLPQTPQPPAPPPAAPSAGTTNPPQKTVWDDLQGGISVTLVITFVAAIIAKIAGLSAVWPVFVFAMLACLTVVSAMKVRSKRTNGRE